MTHKINNICDDAINAFFEHVASQYPEVKTGDLSPDVFAQFQAASREVIKHWLQDNKPDLYTHLNQSLVTSEELLDDIVTFNSVNGRGYFELEKIRETVLAECEAGNLEYFSAFKYLNDEHGVIL